uniref:Amino_oxidase domain-containing protein n=1 Tax=Mesocestoides corti TaxID=53468 RepID=A0A5K3EH22_MESCO
MCQVSLFLVKSLDILMTVTTTAIIHVGVNEYSVVLITQ